MKSILSHLAKHQLMTLLSLSLLIGSCSGKDSTPDEEGDVLLKAGNEVLTFKDVVNKIPVGIEPSDSAAMFRIIADNWVKSRVISDLAERKLADLSDIESKVEAYRNRLIVAEYLKQMKKGKDFNVKADSIRNFYERYKGTLLTETPLVKGIYLKVAANHANLEGIKDLVFCGSDDCIDRLEKSAAADAIQYDYFINDWVDWQTIADQIPYRFYDVDAFLKSTRNFETSYNGSAYFLHISEYLPTGSPQPYEFAAIRIGELMERANIKRFEESLVNSLIEKAIREGSVEVVGYDPLRRTVFRHGTATSPSAGDEPKGGV